ncbi:hypothetical protein FD754_025572, partial [Muntiacus muntjak]
EAGASLVWLRMSEARAGGQRGERGCWPKAGRIHELYLPKFSIKNDYELKDTLSQLGIKKIFAGPDLSGITGTGDLAVSQVSLTKCGGRADGSSPGICKIIAFPVTQSPSLGPPKPRRAGCNHGDIRSHLP